MRLIKAFCWCTCKIRCFLFVLLLGSVVSIQARQITDMAGRKVVVPDRVSRVLPYDNKTNVLLFSVAGSLMIAKARSMESPSLKYISKTFLRLREFDPANAEEVLRLKPDLLVVGAFVGDPDDVARYVAFSKKVQVPLVVVNLELMSLDKSYDFLGNLLGKKAEANTCSQLIRNIYRDAQSAKRGRRVAGKAYVANDNDGLRTVPVGSNHGQLFEEMDIPNVAKVSLNTKGFAQVSMEQLLMWNPDYIFCIGKSASSPYRTIIKSALWHQVTAVKSKHVFFVPSEPYLWFDMPPSVNRLLGLAWFSELFYGQSEEKTRGCVKDFYRIFYQYNLTDKEYAGLFRWQ
jgi:iron complex transport system substrate-binding protein